MWKGKMNGGGGLATVHQKSSIPWGKCPTVNHLHINRKQIIAYEYTMYTVWKESADFNVAYILSI